LASVIAGHISSAIRLARAREVREREERLSTIGQLLASVVHDLKGPMTVISGYARFVQDEEDPKEREAYGKAILRQVETVNAMTGEVLAFARGERNLLESKVYLRTFFTDLAEELRGELEGRPITLNVNIEDRGTALFDQHKIRRALHNLVRNAAEAIGSAGGHIDLGVQRHEADGAILITCRDDGPGVPDEIRARMFDSFTSHGKPQGTGLGLAIVQKIVADHGGRVDMNSRPGETVFTLTLPQRSLARVPGAEAEESEVAL
jgi:signal transduction histidine kinase